MKHHHSTLLRIVLTFGVAANLVLAQTVPDFDNLKKGLYDAAADSRMDKFKHATAELRQKITPSLFEPGEKRFLILKAARHAVTALLASPHLKKENLRTSKDDAILLIEEFLEQTLEHIDPDWKWLRVTANVSPPQGTPMASAGMNPDAIQDPKLRKQYLDLIEDNQRNNLINQIQRELRDTRNGLLSNVASRVDRTPGSGWTPADIKARFGKVEACLKELERLFHD